MVQQSEGSQNSSNPQKAEEPKDTLKVVAKSIYNTTKAMIERKPPPLRVEPPADDELAQYGMKGLIDNGAGNPGGKLAEFHAPIKKIHAQAKILMETVGDVDLSKAKIFAETLKDLAPKAEAASNRLAKSAKSPTAKYEELEPAIIAVGHVKTLHKRSSEVERVIRQQEMERAAKKPEPKKQSALENNAAAGLVDVGIAPELLNHLRGLNFSDAPEGAKAPSLMVIGKKAPEQPPGMAIPTKKAYI